MTWNLQDRSATNHSGHESCAPRFLLATLSHGRQRDDVGVPGENGRDVRRRGARVNGATVARARLSGARRVTKAVDGGGRSRPSEERRFDGAIRRGAPRRVEGARRPGACGSWGTASAAAGSSGAGSPVEAAPSSSGSVASARISFGRLARDRRPLSSRMTARSIDRLCMVPPKYIAVLCKSSAIVQQPAGSILLIFRVNASRERSLCRRTLQHSRQ